MFNEKDNCSSLLTELEDDLFKKDFKFLQLLSNVIPSLPVNTKINTVTNMINNLSGQDYINLKKLNILKNIVYDKEFVYTKYQYPVWIKDNDYFSDFGCFIDYLIRRMTNSIIISKTNRNIPLVLYCLLEK